MRFLNGCIYKAMLFYKMENELNQLEKELLCQSPKEILKSAYELTFKRELLLLFGESSTDFLTEPTSCCASRYPLPSECSA